MTTPDDCTCPGCARDEGCYWPRGMVGRVPWSPGTLDPIELPDRIVGLIGELAGENENALPPAKVGGRHRTAAEVDRDVGSR